MVKFCSIYVNKPPQESADLDYVTTHVSQAEADTCSLDYQLHRFGMDGLQARMEAMRDKFGYADCTVSNNFMELQQKVREATEYFEALPSEVRRQFNDRPENFYDYIDKNQEQAVKDGFIPPSFDNVVKDTAETIDTQTQVDDNNNSSLVQTEEK